MNFYDSPENLAIMCRYMHHRGFDLKHLADALESPKRWHLTWQMAQRWWAHEQELQRRFNEDVAAILKS
jgi:hypothetical protein